MKIRKGFVSNSSSSSFVVAITRDFKLTDEEVELFREGYEEYHGDPCEFSDEQIHEIVAEIIDKSCREGMVYDQDCSNIYAFEHALDDSYILANISAGCEEGGMVNLLKDKDKDAVLATMKTVIQRNNHLDQMKKYQEEENETS